MGKTVPFIRFRMEAYPLLHTDGITGSDVAFSNTRDDGPTGIVIYVPGRQHIDSVHLGVLALDSGPGANTAPTYVVSDGTATTTVGNGNDVGRSVLVQPDGSILVAGSSFNGSDDDFAVVRYRADSVLDTTFSGDGKLTTGIGSNDDSAESMAQQPDGKIVVAGASFAATVDFAVVRYNSDGSLDTTFDADGKTVTAIGADTDRARSLALQTDGRIVVAGYSVIAGNSDFALARYNADGTLDTTFDGDGRVTTAVGSAGDEGNAVAIQADGRILVAGFSQGGGTTDFALVRYNVDGGLDTTFDGDGKVTTDVGGSNDLGYALALQADGKILLAGNSFSGTDWNFSVVRYNADGSLDATFDGDGKAITPIGSADDFARSIAVQADGRILVAGIGAVGANDDFAVVRYNADGSLDTTFDGDGRLTTVIGATNDQAYGIALHADGRFVVAGHTRNGATDDFAVARYLANGVLDHSFGDAGNTLNGAPAYTENAAPVVLDSDVSVFDAELAAQGHYAGATLTLARNGGTNAQDLFSATGLLGALTQGGALVYDGATVGTVMTHSAGTLVLTFDANATQERVDGVLRSLAYSNGSENPSASAQIGWTFSDGNTGAQGSDGALTALGSTTVTITRVNDAPVNTVPGPQTVNEDTNLVVAGVSVMDAEAATVRVTLSSTHGRLSLSGTAGLAFTSGDGVSETNMVFSGSQAAANAALNGLVYLPNANYAGAAAITLTTSDLGVTGTGGTRTDTDTIAVTVNAVNDAPAFNFNPGEVLTPVGSAGDTGQSVAIQADGKILVAGYAHFGGVTHFALVRYNADGHLDTTFDGDGKVTTPVGSGNAYGSGVAAQADGRILMTGFASNGGSADFAVVRFNADGSLDASFDGDGKVLTPVGSTGDTAHSIAVQADGKIVVAGESSNGSNSDFAVVRYNANGSLDTTFSGDGKVTTAISAGGDTGQSVVIQPDGRIVVAGFAVGHVFAVARYNVDGSLDTAFDGDGKATAAFSTNAVARNVTLQPDGKILVAGAMGLSTTWQFALARFNANGSADTTFDGDGKLTLAIGSANNDEGYGVALQADGKIVMSGRSDGPTGSDFAAVRLNANGSLDTTFDADGRLTTALGTTGSDDTAYTIAVQPDGRIVVAGQSSSDFAVVRYNADGSPDASFGAPAYTENGAPVVLDGDVRIADVELAAQGHYGGASLTLARHGGARVDDVFSATGVLSALTQGAALVYSGATVGTVTTNSGGTLVLTFDGNATQTRVDGVLQSIAYANASDAPPASAQIDWSFSDGNGGAQGGGGAGTGSGSITVAIARVQDVYLWSSLVNGQTIPFDPAIDRLRFDDAGITAAGIGVQSIAAVLSYGARALTLQTDVKSMTSGSVIFDGGGVLLIGDDSIGTANDDSANMLAGGAGDDRLMGFGGDDTLDGNAGNDALVGGQGNDGMAGSAGDDQYHVDASGDTVTELPGEGVDRVFSAVTWTLGANVENLTLLGAPGINGTGNGLDNVIVGNSGNNVLTGLAGNDVLTGQGGNDTMIGGLGDDIFNLDVATDMVTELVGEGTDKVNSAVTYTLGANVENLTLTGAANNNGIGNALNNVIVGNTGNNFLTGAGGDDTMAGGLGDDQYSVDAAGDVVTEGVGGGTDRVFSTVSFTMIGYVENLTLLGAAAIDGTGNVLDNIILGNSGNNVLSGGVGIDVLNGQGGDDTMSGGTGDDQFYVDSAGDVVIENVGEGLADKIYSTVTYTLSANVENMTLLGALSIDATGNALNNILVGNSGNNVFDGGLGNDSMQGGAGDDTYYREAVLDSVTEGVGGGTDLVYSSVTYAMNLNVENLILTGAAVQGLGNDLNNSITGNAVNNYLQGGLGTDTLIGGLGNDDYGVDATGDVVTEAVGEGTDRVFTSASYTLGANVENLTLLGAAAIDGTGNGEANMIIGNTANNVLTGLAGDDLLIGGGGEDTMAGGLGNDTYNVDSAGDVVTENAGEGVDRVKTTISYTLTAEVENLTITVGGTVSGTGNGLDNQLIGGAGANVLNGLAGNDLMNGLGGDDTLVWDAADTNVQGGADTDRLRIDGSGVALDLTLIADNVYRDIEIVDLTGTGNNGTTLALADVLAISFTTDTLRVDGNLGDTLTATDSASWATGLDQVIDGVTYHTYTQAAATLLVDIDVLSNL